MPSANNSNVFCADYSSIASCLFAIQASEDAGLFAADQALLEMLRLFESDALRRLLNRTVRILGKINHAGTDVSGDYNAQDFSNRTFSVGYLLGGDFYEQDFYETDFYVGFLDTSNNGYSSAFQTIVNIFTEFCERSPEISEEDKAALTEALVYVLDAFDALQAYLTAAGLNPCVLPEKRYFNNSPSVYLQAAGADGTDGVPAGLHLRWSLNGDLGYNHLPRGNYHVTGSGFNKTDDFVYLSRTPYSDPMRFAVNFEADRPVIDYTALRWTYLLTNKTGGKTYSNQVQLTFDSRARYDEVASAIDPRTGYFAFLKNYPSVVGITIVGKTMFSTGFDFWNPAAAGIGYLKIEAVCALQATGVEAVSVRKSVSAARGQNVPVSLVAENIQMIRWKKTAGSFVQGFTFETYHDFQSSRQEEDWSAVGAGFALSLDDQQVFDRLESADYPVDNHWPQFNDGTRVRVANYRDKWQTTRPNEPSLKTAVTTYLTLSETDPRAEDVVRADNSDPLVPGLLISYLDIINMMATDYHFARMLGMGHIDTEMNAAAQDKFIYRLTYRNREAITSSVDTDYVCLTIPVSQADHLLPETPQIRPLTYGLPEKDVTGSKLFDENGYTDIDNVRVINVGRELFGDEQPGHDFFADLTAEENANIFQHAKAIFYGIEYRRAGDPDYVKPEITQDKAIGTVFYAYDDDFPDTGVPETVPVPDDPDSLLIHFNRNPGIQVYAIYGVNWFSRASARSAEVLSDESTFPLRNILKPPADIAIQYIQKEDTLIFTTMVEQQWLKLRREAFPGADASFTRLTFNWLDIVDITQLADSAPGTLTEQVVRPDKIKSYFKPDLVLEITGVVTAVKPVPGFNTRLRVITGPYNMIDGTTVSPYISAADYSRFTDSLLNTEDGKFRVLQISTGTPWPVITVEKLIETTTVEDEEAPGIYAAQKNTFMPQLFTRFSMVENLSRPANWEPVAEAIEVVSFADAQHPVIESSADSEGNLTHNWIGGISGQAEVTALFSDSLTDDDLPGYYLVEFAPGVQLPAHPQVNIPFDPADPDKNEPGTLHQAHVEWYKGLIRIPYAADGQDMKMLEVMRIEQADPLILFVFDPTFEEEPIARSQISTDLVHVNFHPGYRVYLFPEPAPDFTFNGAHILPSGNQNDKRTFVGLQSADTRPGGSGFSSGVSVPVVLMARNIVEPLVFEAPIASSYKVRPNETGRAAFTFDIKVATTVSGATRSPFGFRFYRTTNIDVLNALYKPATLTQVLANLNALTRDEQAAQRIFELVNLIFDPAAPGQFKIFDALPAPYGFPRPDHAGLPGASESLELRLEKYKLAVASTFLQMTEQPPVFNFIKQGEQTENALPRIKDLDGNYLDPADDRFDPFPMVRWYIKSSAPGFTYIRFTDYTLNGASRYLYFYGGAEIDNQLVAGETSPLAGPVTVLQTMPSDAPAVRSYGLDLTGTDPDIPVSVTFDIAPMSPDDHHHKLRIYRTTDQGKVYSLSQMLPFVESEIEENAPGGYHLTDDLSGLDRLAAGSSVYYRIAGVRTISNEQDLPEDVLSLGSDVVTVKIIDVNNPKAPVLTYDAPSNTLHWTATANYGIYSVFKQNNRGNWQRLSTVAGQPLGTAMSFELPGPLVVTDENGLRIYHRFKVLVENASGLRNLTDLELTV